MKNTLKILDISEILFLCLKVQYEKTKRNFSNIKREHFTFEYGFTYESIILSPLTIVTSSILEILLTKIFTRTTVGPSETNIRKILNVG